jgi:3-hydroxyisobutyrate dehydrogenase
VAGGDREDIDRILPVLEVLGQTTHIVPVGAGHGLKAPNNLMSATHLLITSEAVLAGEKFGIEPAVMLETVNGSSDEVDPPTTNGLTSFFQARITQDSTCP